MKGNLNDEFRIGRRVKQGGINYPCLYYLHVDELMYALKQNRCSCYIDDKFLYYIHVDEIMNALKQNGCGCYI